MSNQIVGSVYQQIIERVIAASVNDFEEYGVEQVTLDEMKQEWQEKLSALRIAQFPWDPQPEPPRQPPTVPSNVKQDSEPISVSSYQTMPANGAYTSGLNPNLAAQRAQQLINQRLQNTPNAPQHMGQHGGQSPLTQEQRIQMQQAQAQQAQQAQRISQQQQQQRPPNPYHTQTDGADEDLEDWKALMAQKEVHGDNEVTGRIAADRLMRAQIDAMAAEMDSGLMVPLSEMPKGKRRAAAIRVLQRRNAECSLPTPADPDGLSQVHSRPTNLDGEDDKTDDEDAINSDLDDPEDDLDADGEGDDDMVDYMLCTYDKVQRVKNKWKCTLKDGILTTNKKEYLFHKATGEFEW